MRTNRKEVKNKIREHILDFYTMEELKSNIEGLDYVGYTTYARVQYMVQGGSFLCYYTSVKDFLNGLEINPNNKEYSDEKSWELYKHLIAREVEAMLKGVK